MPQRFVFGLTWFVAMIAATGIGLTAVSTVGDVIRGSGPLGQDFEDHPPALPTPPEQADTIRRTSTFRSVTATATCAGSTARLVAAEPQPGWRITEIERGPDEDVDVTLLNRGKATRIEFYCNHGDPQPVVTR